MTCQDTLQKLSTYADSEISADDLRELNHHLEQCASCRQTLEEYRSLDWLLKNKSEQPITDQYLDSFYDQLFETIEQQQLFADPHLQGDEYPLLERLGESATGERYLTRTSGEEDAPHPLLLKRLSARFAEDSEYLLAFIRSGQLTSQLKHKHICPIVKAGTDSKGPFLVRGYIPGMDLQALIRRHGIQRRLIPQPATLMIISAISQALEHASREIVHGCLNPGNVLVGFSGEISLINFGMGKYWTAQIAAGSGVPTEHQSYLAPEHFTGGEIDQRTDVFTLSLIMYELLTGKEVFPEGMTRQLLTELTRESIPPPSSVRPSLAGNLDAMVMKGLELDPARRYQSVREFREEIEGIIADDTGSGMDLSGLMARTFANEAREEEARAALVVSGAVPELPSVNPPEVAPTPAEATAVAGPAPPAPEAGAQVPSIALAPQAVMPGVLPEEPGRSSRRWMGIAAAILLIATGGILFSLMRAEEKPAAVVAMAVPQKSSPEATTAPSERPAPEPPPPPAPAATAAPQPEPAMVPAPDLKEAAAHTDMAEEPAETKPAPKPRARRFRRRRPRKHSSRPRSRLKARQAKVSPKPAPTPRPSPVATPKPPPVAEPSAPKPAAYGYLKVISATAVDVVVDGWKASTVSGKLNMKLTPGSHQVRVVFKESGRSFNKTVVIKAGRSKVLRLVQSP